MAHWKHNLYEKARAAGFMDVRVADATPHAAAAVIYREWIAAGYHGEMAYLANLLDERTTGLDHVLPGARSIIMFAASYYGPGAEFEKPKTSGEKTSTTMSGQRLRVARYALGQDYHYVFKDRLKPVVEWLAETFPGQQWRIATDSAPIMERTYAAASGLGFIGKNGLLISWMQGSLTLLACVVTTAHLEPDSPRPGTCGNCTRCIDACPTQAIIAPGKLDARRCISYLTIEKRTPLTGDEVSGTGEWVFGCDICQEVCPYNKGPEEALMPEFTAGRIVRTAEPAETFLEPESNRQFERRFAGSPLLRPGKRRLQGLVQRKLMEEPPRLRPECQNTPPEIQEHDQAVPPPAESHCPQRD